MPLAVWLLALASATLFGLGLILTQRGLRHITPAQGAMISIPTAGLLFWSTAPLTTDLSGFRWDAVLVFLCVGSFYPAAATILTFESTRLVGPHVTGALGNLAPLFAVLAAVLILAEAPGAAEIGGLAAIVLGATLLTTGRAWQDRPLLMWALLLPLAASVIRGISAPLLKVGFALWNNPMAATLACYVMSASVALITGGLRTRGTGATFNRSGIAWFVAVGFANGFATLSLICALSGGPVKLVAPVVACYPLFTLLIGALIGQSMPVGKQAVGVALTVAGVVLLVTAPR